MAESFCADEIRAVRNEYMRNWRARNKDKVRAINQRYWAKYATRKREVAADEQKADAE